MGILYLSHTAAKNIADFSSGVSTPLDFRILPLAFSTVYTYASVVPLIVWGLGKYYKINVGWLEAIDIYGKPSHFIYILGYGLIVWIPASVICVAPFDMVRWGVVALAFGVSGWFMASNLKGVVGESEGSGGGFVIYCFMGVAHFALAILFKTQFFSQSVGSGGAVGGGGGAANATMVGI
jgi:hypothetical protein